MNDDQIQSEHGMNAPATTSAVAALRFFLNHTADPPDLARKLIRLRYPRKRPNVSSPDETAHLIAATTCLKHRAALCITYGAGLRVAEVASLKVGDIDRERMLIRVERGKGGDAVTPCSRRTCWRCPGPGGSRRGVTVSCFLLAGWCWARTRPTPSPPASSAASSTPQMRQQA